MMKANIVSVVLFLLGVVCLVALSACKIEGEVTPNYQGGTYQSESFEVFNGLLNGEAVQFRYGTGQYYCNSADSFTYETGTNAAVMNDDTTQATCSNTTVTRVDVSEQTPVLPLVQISP